MQHFIQMVSQLATAKLHCLDPARLAAANAKFQSMLNESIICYSSSH
jgi:hypothetical protein